MKKHTLILLVIGTLCMGISLFTRHLFYVSETGDDFLKGLGIAFIITALLVQRRFERKS